jgi:hypothetical protein
LPKTGYNAVLCNLYRNGNDSVGLHADAEPEMGPVIASVSLGAGRVFRLKRKDGSVRNEKNDRQNAEHLLRLLVENHSVRSANLRTLAVLASRRNEEK